MTSYFKISWQNETKASDIILMLHDCIMYDINMALLCWKSVAKVDINLVLFYAF